MRNMMRYVRQNQEWDINDVTLFLTQVVPPLRRDNINTLMRSLKTDLGVKDEINRKFDGNVITVADAFEEVIREWRQRMSNHATLIALGRHLYACDLITHADKLQNDFRTTDSEAENIQMSFHSENVQSNNINQDGLNIRNACNDGSGMNGSLTQSFPLSVASVAVGSMQENEHVNIIQTVTQTTENCDDTNIDENTPLHDEQISNKTIQYQPRIACKFKQKTKIFMLMVAIGIIAVLGWCFHLIHGKLTNKLDIVTTPNTLKMQDDGFSEQRSPRSMDKETCIEIYVPYQEYDGGNSLILHDLAPVCLFIQSNKWMQHIRPSVNLTIENVVDITIDGCTPATLVVAVLQEFSLVKNLTFSNKNGTNCEATDYNLDSINQAKISLNNLMYVNVNNVENNREIFAALAKRFVMLGVVSLKVNNLILYHEDVIWVRRFLKQIRFSIEILAFLNVTWETALFQNMKFKVTKLYELRIDLLCFQKYDCNILGDIPSHAPVLRNFISEQGYLSLDENGKVLKIKEAEIIQYSLRIGKDEDILNVSMFTNLLKLKNASIVVSFEDLNNCHIAGKGSISSDILSIETECKKIVYTEN